MPVPDLIFGSVPFRTASLSGGTYLDGQYRSDSGDHVNGRAET
jgi:hypothetical protein